MKFPFKLAENRDFDAVGFGTNAVDRLIIVPQYPAKYGKIRLSDTLQMAGGEVATTMAGLQRLGMKTSYIGRFGSDNEGDFGLRSLKDEGVDVTFTEQVEGAKNQVAFIIIDESNGERTVIWDRDKKLSYSAEDAPMGAARLGRILHFTPHDVEACLMMAEAANKADTVVSIDIDNIFEGVGQLLGKVDILIASQEFPEKLLGISDKKIALLELKQRFGCKVVGITLGESGSILMAGDSFIESSGFAVPGGCKDTTGAGDAFRVGLLYGLLQGEDIEDAAKMANAVAALKCRMVGARTALPTPAELSEIISN